MTKMQELARLGQAIWLDYIRRSFIKSGDLQQLINAGLGGITSNPTIFSAALAGSADYDTDLMCLVNAGKSLTEIYETLILDDIARAADLLLPVYQETDGYDGFVSLEVSPGLANDTDGTIAEAMRLFAALQRPNVMIKIPATPAGIPAITRAIRAGINVNVTLIFSLDNYRKVAAAYISGLEQRWAEGQELTKIASVASFFVSRVDTAVDRELQAHGHTDLAGKIAIANSKVAYQLFQEIFSGSRWQKLQAEGARRQRLLWASTGIRNPLYSDTLYVDELIGPDTVNTLPPATLNAFLDHGTVQETLSRESAIAQALLKRLEQKGIDLNAITTRLQQEGIKLFSDAYDGTLKNIAEKSESLLASRNNFIVSTDAFKTSVQESIERLRSEKIIDRIWRHDHTVWKPDAAEISNRLGWLHSPVMMPACLTEMAELVTTVQRDGYSQALLLGMGGSSLAPEVFRATFGVKNGYLDLEVLDSTDPGAVLAHAKRIQPEKALIIVSTKSGGTVETFSLLKYFYNFMLKTLGPDTVGQHFIAITDPGSGLESMAKSLKFRKIFLNDPNIGGRFSALSYFGLVPAALIGVDIKLLLERAHQMICNCEGCNCPVSGNNTCGWFGTVMGTLALAGRDKLTLITSPSLAAFGAWAEQLIAESTGKEGKGILPVIDESIAGPDQYANDRQFVYLRLEGDSEYDTSIKALKQAGLPMIQIHLRDCYDLGGEIFRWEMATAIAGWRLGINPFDQPNVESAKILSRQMMAEFQKQGQLPELIPVLKENGISVFTYGTPGSLRNALQEFLSLANPGDPTGKGRSYVALQAYVQPADAITAALQKFRSKIQERYRLATTIGYGPRFLHSTGQLHKGDAGNGLFIQLTAAMPEDAAIPVEPGQYRSSIRFGVLKTAQALGDRQALLDNGRRVICLDLGEDILASLTVLTHALE